MKTRMPALFVGHGSPMNAIEDNIFSRTWRSVGRSLPTPRAIVCISAHWESVGTRVTAMARPETLYDFHGFPGELYEVAYPAPGDPDLARLIKKTITDPVIHLDFGWGLDHGAWSVLRRMFPAADVPVLQISLDFEKPPSFHFELGRKLRPFRDRGVLILGSGNMVHNLRKVVWEDVAFDWAQRADERIADEIVSAGHDALVGYPSLDGDMRLAIPTNEHYLPLLAALGAGDPSDDVNFFCDRVTLGSISMRSVRLG